VIAAFTDVRREARLRGTAAAAFTCYDAESAAGVLRAAAGGPVIILVSAQLVVAPGGDLLVAALRGMAEHSRSRVCMELDHAHQLDAIRAGCELGLGAVMADGSHLPRDANAEFVLAARDIASPLGIAVEAELGRVEGEEEVATTADVDARALTDPLEAERFARDTGADCLAVAIGNAHGLYRGRPRLDLPRLRAIRSRVRVPLALHGGSGLPPDVIRTAVAAGIAKININTELRQAYLARTARELAPALDGARLLALHRSQTEAVEAVAAQKLAVLRSPEWIAIQSRPREPSRILDVHGQET
jgi:tagatose 1,6-diphosphate aldolase GatY/KbaY